MEGYIAEIRLFAANFAPRNWGYCNGAILSIAQNTALFSLLGTTYGGNGQTTFGLPDFRGRVGVGTGTASGLQSFSLGELSGSETVTLTTNNMPAHSHTASANLSPAGSNLPGEETNPNGSYPGLIQGGNVYASTHNSTMGSVSMALTIGPSGNSAPHNNIQPSLGMNYIICLYGIFPSRN